VTRYSRHRGVMFEVEGASVYLYMEMDGGQKSGR
jgi:hypothetical protein